MSKGESAKQLIGEAYVTTAMVGWMAGEDAGRREGPATGQRLFKTGSADPTTDGLITLQLYKLILYCYTIK